MDAKQFIETLCDDGLDNNTIIDFVESQQKRINELESDSKLLDWLETAGGEIQFSNMSCKWWVNWYSGDDGSNHKSGMMFDSVRGALRSAFRGEEHT